MRQLRKKLLLVTTFLILALAFAGCGEPGTPPVLTVGGVQITLGESVMGDLEKEGFETGFAGAILPNGTQMAVVGKMPANSWLSDLITLKKDKESYGYLCIYNPGRNENYYSNCIIYKLQFKMKSEENSYWAEDNILVNGINFFGMDSPAVKEAMSDYKLARETDAGSLRYEDGEYKYYFRFDQNTGLVDEIELEQVIAKDY